MSNKLNWVEWNTLLRFVINLVVNDYSPTIIIPMMKGGLIPGGIIASILKIGDVRPVSVARKGSERYFLWPESGQIGDVREARVLIVEDDVPTGAGVHFLKEHLRRLGAVDIRTMCVFKGVDAIDVDYCAKTQDAKTFPIYPWKTTNLGDRLT